MTDIEKLKELEAKATPGPWVRQTMEPQTLGYEWIDAPGYTNVAVCRELTKFDLSNRIPLRPELDEITANTELIVAMRNSLPALLASLASKDAEIERLNKRVMFWQGQAFEADLAAQAIEENTALKAELHGEARDARSNDSITGAWKAECEKQRERADKFMWQVRDTCARANSAESRLTTALAALERLASAKLLSQIRPLVAGWNGENLPPEKRYGRHHAELGVTLRTNTGEVYAIDEAIVEARATLAKLNALEGNEAGGGD